MIHASDCAICRALSNVDKAIIVPRHTIIYQSDGMQLTCFDLTKLFVLCQHVLYTDNMTLYILTFCYVY